MVANAFRGRQSLMGLAHHIFWQGLSLRSAGSAVAKPSREGMQAGACRSGFSPTLLPVLLLLSG